MIRIGVRVKLIKVKLDIMCAFNCKQYKIGDKNG